MKNVKVKVSPSNRRAIKYLKAVSHRSIAQIADRLRVSKTAVRSVKA